MDKLGQIFERQGELTKEFQRIEQHNGLSEYYVRGYPYDIQDPQAQKALRATAWYMIEELGEVWSSHIEADRLIEIADVFHFLVELFICSGIGPEFLYPAHRVDKDRLDFAFETSVDSNQAIEYLVYSLAVAMHCLKAKPWKAHPKTTSITLYHACLKPVFFAFIDFAANNGVTSESLFNAYMRKADVNKERIDGGA
jgi:hypothetical protein